MKRDPVDSSSIVSAGFDSASLTLEVEFNDGKVYQYFDVPADVYAEMISSESVGRFFTKSVRGHYRYARV